MNQSIVESSLKITNLSKKVSLLFKWLHRWVHLEKCNNNLLVIITCSKISCGKSLTKYWTEI